MSGLAAPASRGEVVRRIQAQVNVCRGKLTARSVQATVVHLEVEVSGAAAREFDLVGRTETARSLHSEVLAQPVQGFGNGMGIS